MIIIINDKLKEYLSELEKEDMDSFLAILTSPSGKSFRYQDKALSFKNFVDYVSTIYPDHTIESVTAI